jgi:RHS repeat-associated protein
MTALGKTTSYTYNSDERLATVSQPALGIFIFTYNPDGQLTTLARPNGVTSTSGYDAAGRQTSLSYKTASGSVIAGYAYTLDSVGNRTGATDASGKSESYVLDAAGRLTSVTHGDGSKVSFGYDAAGNRASMTSGGSTTAYVYNAASELTSAGGTTYTYDPAGNRLTAGSTSYTWDAFGNLASQTGDATSVSYQTNGAGLRIRATSADGSTADYTWDAASALPALLSDGTDGYLSADSKLLAESSDTASSYPITDALGSVRSLTDNSGAITASAEYGAYGDIRSSSGSIGSLSYTGALTGSANSIYLNARSLDTATGTMLSRDPLNPGGPGVTGFNPYPYAAQNPTTDTDPSGRLAAEYGDQLNNDIVPFDFTINEQPVVDGHFFVRQNMYLPMNDVTGIPWGAPLPPVIGYIAVFATIGLILLSAAAGILDPYNG